MKKYFVGVDLGQTQDPTAIAILEQIPVEDGEVEAKPDRAGNGHTAPKQKLWRYNCSHIERLPLDTRYPAVVDYVAKLIETPALKAQCSLVIDASGVGKPVADLFTQANIPFDGVTITGGDKVTSLLNMHNVAKRVLVSTLQMLLHTERLTFAPHAERQALVRELQNFRVTVTEAANDTYAGRAGTHDDMVLAVALAAWKGEQPVYKLEAPPHSRTGRY